MVTVGGTARQVDLATCTQWVDAYSLRRTELADFYSRRFRQEFRPAVLAWLKDGAVDEPERASESAS